MSERRSGGLQGAVQKAGRRYFGPFPKRAPKSVQLGWRRQMELKAAFPSLPVVILAVIVINATWVYIVFGVLVAWWVGGHALLTRHIRRARRAELGE